MNAWFEERESATLNIPDASGSDKSWGDRVRIPRDWLTVHRK